MLRQSKLKCLPPVSVSTKSDISEYGKAHFTIAFKATIFIFVIDP